MVGVANKNASYEGQTVAVLCQKQPWQVTLLVMPKGVAINVTPERRRVPQVQYEGLHRRKATHYRMQVQFICGHGNSSPTGVAHPGEWGTV